MGRQRPVWPRKSVQQPGTDTRAVDNSSTPRPQRASGLRLPESRPTVAPPRAPNIAGATFRLNPDLRLVPHQDLDRGQQAVFAGLAEDADHFGLVVPQSVPELGIRAVDHRTANLLGQLATPGSPPAAPASGVDTDRQLAALVLDGILEIEVDGDFIKGVDAGNHFWPDHDVPHNGPIAELSRDALRVALHLPDNDPVAVSSWIYAANTAPLGPSRLAGLGDEDRLAYMLGLDDSGRARQHLSDDYVETRRGGWQSWQRLAGRSADEQHLQYKLYLSPTPEGLVEVFQRVLEVLVAARVPAFKLGRGPSGVVRPDKLVVYLPNWEHLVEIVDALVAELQDTPAQGVPFTAAATDDGLLSWGMDPPPSTQLTGWGKTESWRSWLTNRLARGLIYARRTGAAGTRAIDFALARVALEGVDTALWTPSDQVWASTENHS